MDPVTTAALAGSAPHADLSLIGLFWQADIVVKVVMLMLIAASVWVWTIAFQKIVQFRQVFRNSKRFDDAFWSAASMDDLFARIGGKPRDPQAATFCAAMRELQETSRKLGNAENLSGLSVSLKDRLDRVMRTTINREMAVLERYLGFLATIGSAGPFIGLFGTVWGIMNSFQAIGVAKNTSLAVVAPGIAEALFATAIGLIAAIPAVMLYNKFSADVNRYGNQLEAFADDLLNVLSRKLEAA
jgi:biopolymer transport protein TolQ